MNLKEIKSDFFIEDIFDNTIRNWALLFAAHIRIKGIPHSNNISLPEVYRANLLSKLAGDMLENRSYGRPIDLRDTMRLIYGIGHGADCEGRFKEDGMILDFNELRLPEHIFSEGNYDTDHPYG